MFKMIISTKKGLKDNPLLRKENGRLEEKDEKKETRFTRNYNI